MTAISTEQETLRELINEHGIYSITALLVDFVGELEDGAATEEENRRWAQCGEGFKTAKRFADVNWKDDAPSDMANLPTG